MRTSEEEKDTYAVDIGRTLTYVVPRGSQVLYWSEVSTGCHCLPYQSKSNSVLDAVPHGSLCTSLTNREKKNIFDRSIVSLKVNRKTNIISDACYCYVYNQNYRL